MKPGMKMLIVEDDSIMVGLLHQIFVSQTIHSTDHLDHAIAIARNIRPDFIMLDLGLPNSQPDETATVGVKLLREAAPDAAIMIFSGYASEDRKKQVLAHGADAIVEKGMSLKKEDIARGMSEALTHKGGACQGFLCLIEGMLGVKL